MPRRSGVPQASALRGLAPEGEADRGLALDPGRVSGQGEDVRHLRPLRGEGQLADLHLGETVGHAVSVCFYGVEADVRAVRHVCEAKSGYAALCFAEAGCSEPASGRSEGRSGEERLRFDQSEGRGGSGRQVTFDERGEVRQDLGTLLSSDRTGAVGTERTSLREKHSAFLSMAGYARRRNGAETLRGSLSPPPPSPEASHELASGADRSLRRAAGLRGSASRPGVRGETPGPTMLASLCKFLTPFTYDLPVESML